MRSARSEEGFTYLEVIAALAILGVLGGVIVAGVRLPLASLDTAISAVTEDEGLRRLHARLMADVASAAYSPINPDLRFEGDTRSLRVTTGVDGDNKPKTAFYRFDPVTGLFSKDDGAGETGTPSETPGVRAQEVFIEYLDGTLGVWRRQWSSERLQRLPAAVRVRLIGIGRSRRQVEEWLFPIYTGRIWSGSSGVRGAAPR